MKKSKIALRLISLALTFVLIFSMSGLSVFAADESDYVAEFRIETDKVTAKTGEDVTVSVKLKTNYYICTMSLVVIYDGEKFIMQNTSEDNLKGYLTFTGSMANKYYTTGNWKSPEKLYTKNNANTDFWSRDDIMNKYKLAFVTWSADTTLSPELVKLEEEETIIQFTLRATEDVDDMSELIFMSDDFIKTDKVKQGVWFVGRSKTSRFAVTQAVYTGQTIIYNGIDPTEQENDTEVFIAPGENTNTYIDRENNLIYGLETNIDSLESFVKVEGYTLEYDYFKDCFGTGTKVKCILNGVTKEEYEVVIFGDLTGDGVIDIYDVSVFSAVTNGDIELSDGFSIAADVLKDDCIDIYDYMIAVGCVNGDTEISQILNEE